MKQIKIRIDNKNYVFSEEMTVLQACVSIGLEIPRFCYHEKLTIAGNCRMCLVEIAQPRSLKPMASCAINILDEMVIFTNTMLVKKARESVLEFLLANHPLDCPICDQGGECDLQDQSMIYGSDRGRFYEGKRAVNDKECGPLIKTIMTRCIHCTRCVRFSEEIAGISTLGVLGRGNQMEIGFYIENFLDSEMSGNIIDLCPVGALTSKPYAFVARPWELKSFEVCDIIDSVGSRIRVDIRGLEVLRILPSVNEDLNEDWISDKTRFFYDSIRKQRLYTPLLKYYSFVGFKKINILIAVSWNLIFCFLSNLFDHFFKLHNKLFLKSKIFGFFGNLVDGEALTYFKILFNFLGCSSIFYQKAIDFSYIDFRKEFFFEFSYKVFEHLDFLILINFNPRFELPLLNLRIRKAFLYNNLFVVSLSFITNLTYKIFQNNICFFKFFNILEGKHFLTTKLLFSQKPLLIFGQKFFSNYNSFNIFPFKDFLIKYNYNFLLFKIFNFSSILNSKELGINCFNYVKDFAFFFKSKYNYFFLLGTEFLQIDKKNNSNNVIIYQGHHTDQQASFSDVILPGCSFLEKESFFFNLLGNLQKTKIIVYPPKLAREDWKILYNFRNFYNLNMNKKKKERDLTIFKKIYMKNDKKKITILNNYLINLFSYKNYQIKKLNIILDYYNNFILITNNFNFYRTDHLTLHSKTLSFCSKRFLYNQFNFLN